MISLADQLSISNAILDMDRLVHLDQIWTHRLAAREPLSDAEVGQLSQLVGELDTLLTKLPEHCDTFEKCLIGDGVAVPTYSQDAENQLSEYRKMLRSVLPDLDVDVSATTLKQRLDFLRSNVSAERHELSAKLAAIQQGNAQSGDLGRAYMCNVGGTLFAGGLLGLGIPGGQAVAGAAIGTAIGISILYRCLEP